MAYADRTGVVLPLSAPAEHQWWHALRERQVGRLQLLMDMGRSVDAPDSSGTTALIAAADRRDLPMLTWLIDRGAEVNAINHAGETALSIAQRHCWSDGEDVLREAGAMDTQAAGSRQRTMVLKPTYSPEPLWLPMTKQVGTRLKTWRQERQADVEEPKFRQPSRRAGKP